MCPPSNYQKSRESSLVAVCRFYLIFFHLFQLKRGTINQCKLNVYLIGTVTMIHRPSNLRKTFRQSKSKYPKYEIFTLKYHQIAVQLYYPFPYVFLLFCNLGWFCVLKGMLKNIGMGDFECEHKPKMAVMTSIVSVARRTSSISLHVDDTVVNGKPPTVTSCLKDMEKHNSPNLLLLLAWLMHQAVFCF